LHRAYLDPPSQPCGSNHKRRSAKKIGARWAKRPERPADRAGGRFERARRTRCP
jgi:hypothetical protein